MKPFHIDLLRHGAVNGPPALYGRTDVALSTPGMQQLQQVALSPAYSSIVSSPRQRCLIFARQLAEQRRLPLLVDDALAEMDFGEWDGLPFAEDSPHWMAMQHFWESPAQFGPREGETLTAFQARVNQAFGKHLSRLNGDQLWVVHAGVIRAILAGILRADFSQPAWHQALHIGYASLTRLAVSPSTGVISIRFIGLPPAGFPATDSSTAPGCNSQEQLI